MCGIAGMFAGPGKLVQRSGLERCLSLLAHRGPDDQGVWIDSEQRIGLAHTRLSIIDVAGGRQPLTNEDGSIHVVFNGEIYNHVELRGQLEEHGHRFRTKSDTEVIAHLYEEYETGLFSRLHGMFAVAIWDERRGRLVLGRDRLGKKPLFVARSSGNLAFASEIKALWPLVEFGPDLNAAAICHYLTLQYVPGETCAFEGIEKLQPGEYLVAAAGGCRRERYWQAPVPKPTFQGTFDEAAVELRRLLLEATQVRLRSDVPLGVLLSGGIDSAIVTGLVAQCGAASIRTFTAAFHESEFDERPYARAVARRFSTQHHELIVEPPTFELAGRIADQYDEPFADSSAIPTWQIARLAREHVKVALTGDGGDETLLGYSRYVQYVRYLRQRRWAWPLLRASGLRWCARRLCPAPRGRTWRRRLLSLATMWDAGGVEVYVRWLGAFHGRYKDRLCTPAFAETACAESSSEQSSAARIAAGVRRFNSGNLPAAAAAFDLVSYLPDDVLTKVDRASMAHGLECRSPLLDHRVVEFLATLPFAWKLHPRHGSKWILRYACRDLLPEEVLHRGKQGFAVPLGRWLRHDWTTELETACLPYGPLADWLSADYVRELIGEHRSGAEDHAYRLWTLACLNRVARRAQVQVQ